VRSSSPSTQVLATAARVWNSWSGAVRSIPDSLPILHPRGAPHTAKDAGEGVGHAPSVRNSRTVNRRVSWPATLAAQHDEARVPQGDVAGSTRLLRQVRRTHVPRAPAGPTARPPRPGRNSGPRGDSHRWRVMRGGLAPRCPRTRRPSAQGRRGTAIPTRARRVRADRSHRRIAVSTSRERQAPA